ncbi:MAG: hypothetical protein GF307_06615 [candidate division Zixibacteria bacterium]|nr:hypothetical protein [candidate division Zixibacteria bacterium]
MIKRLPILAIIIFILAPALFAQDVDIRATVDKTEVGLDEQINLSLSITADSRAIPDPKVPEIRGFEIYSSGSSQSFNFINGQVSSSVTHNYVLIPTRPGKYTIPPFTVRVKAKEYQSRAINVTVLKSSTRSTKPPASNSRGNQITGAGKDAEKIFITASVDKKTAYVNEQVTLTFKFYQAIRLLGSPELTRPSFSGFWVEDLPPQKTYYENVNGVRYYVTEIKSALFPTSPGEKVIEPFKVTVMPDDFTSFFGRDPFDMFGDNFFGRRRSEPKILTTDQVKLNIKPLPLEGKPSGYTGAVGQFSMQAMPDIVETEANQPINFTVRISGTGNIKAIERPQLKVPPEFRSYPSNSSENISKEGYKLSGTRTFEEVLIPKSPGSFDLPAVEFSYFDPRKEKYVTLKSEIYSFKVNPSEGNGAGAGMPVAVQDIGSSIKDLRYLKTEITGQQTRMALYSSPVFWALQVVPLLAIIGVLAVRKHRDKLEDDAAYARRVRAKSISKRVLKEADSSLRKGDKIKFYSAVSRALTGYLADKLALSAAGLTTDMMHLHLKDKVSGKQLDEILNVLRLCDFHRFASVSESNGQEREFLNRVEKLIMELEKSL